MKQQWDKEEVEFLKANYQKMTYTQLARALGRTKHSIRLKLYNIGLRKNELRKISSESLCLTCDNARADRCEWIRAKVKIWDAAKSHSIGDITIYEVTSCKKYMPDKRIGKVEAGGAIR